MPYIKDLRLKNFKNYIDEYFQFSDVNVFYGDNGSGKSGVIQALVLLLANKALENIGDYKRTTTESFTLESNFIHTNLNHYYEMQYDTAPTKLLKIDGMPKALTTPSAITKKMAEIITGDLAVFSSVSLQGDSSKIFTANASDSMSKITKILQLDKLTKISELLKIDLDEYNKQLVEFRKDATILENMVYETLDEEEPESIDEISETFKNLEEVKVNKLAYEKDLQEYNSLKATYDRVLKDYNKFSKIKQDTLSAITKLEAEIESLSYDEEELNTLQNSINDINLKKSSLREKKGKFSDLVAELAQLKDEGVQVKSEVSELESIELIKQEDVDLVFKRKEEITEYYYGIKQSLDEINKKIKLNEQGKCSECGNDCTIHNLDEVLKSKLEYEIKLKENKIILDEVSKELQTITKQKSDLDTKVAVLPELKNKVEKLRNEYAKKLEEKNLLDKEIISIDIPETDIASLKSKLEKLKDIKTKHKTLSDELVEEKATLKANEVSYKNSLNELIDEPQEPEKFLKEFDEKLYNDIQKKINVHEEKVKNYNKAVEHNKGINQQKKDNDDKKEKLEKDIELCERRITLIKNARVKAEKDLTPYAIDKATSHLMNLTNHYFSKLFPELEVAYTQNGKEMEFYFQEIANKIPIKVKLSAGFELQAMALSFREALTLMSGLGIFFGDEIDSDASVANSKLLYDSLMSCGFGQYFCITHKEETVDHLINNYNARCFKLIKGKIVEIVN